MIGTFLEDAADLHVGRREALLASSALPAPTLPRLVGRAVSFLSDGRVLAEAAVRSHGLAIVQLDAPLSVEEFIRFARSLGSLVPERDPAVLPYVEAEAILHLRTSDGRTENVSRQPFASNFLTLHTESSGHATAEQPRFVALMCVEQGDPDASPQTVVVPMAAVVERLTAATIAVLQRTRYDNDRGSPSILRHEDGRWIVCFRDFHRQSLAWAHDGDAPPARVNAAIRELLAAMYEHERAAAVRWQRGMMVVVDNQVYFHGRSEGRQVQGETRRHLVRARIRLQGRDDLTTALPAARTDQPRLFWPPMLAAPCTVDPVVVARADVADIPEVTPYEVFVDDRTLDVYARAEDPTDPLELRDLWLGRVEAELGANGIRPELAAQWARTRVRRAVNVDEVLCSRATVRFVKELFNTYFRDDLYGVLRSQSNVILSGGSVDETAYGLPTALKETLQFALVRDWYGYSDSRGREPSRNAIAAYESARITGARYTAEHVVLTMGATHAISSIGDLVLADRQFPEPVLCGIPNYPPLVQALTRRHAVRLVPTPSTDGRTSLDGLRRALTPRTPMVLLQTGANPTGALVDEHELECFLAACAPSTIVVLDECHEWLGPPRQFTHLRARPNVVRVSSVSKEWSAPGLKVGWFLADSAFVAEYYEHASTSYGGPPSFVYTLVEFLASFERWRLEGRDSIGHAQVVEFEASYGLAPDTLGAAYRAYVAERAARETALIAHRGAVVTELRALRASVVPPRCSINLLATLPGYDDSYRCFRELLRETGVSFYPAILGFRFAGGCVRATSARKWSELSEAFARLRHHRSPEHVR